MLTFSNYIWLLLHTEGLNSSIFLIIYMEFAFYNSQDAIKQ